MSNKFLSKMLYALTSAYSRKDYDNVQLGLPLETNIGKLFSILAWGLETVEEQAELVRLWDDLDYACGSVLDRYGANFGVKRVSSDDRFYRLAIKVKIMAQLSGGDTDTVIRAAAMLLDVDLLRRPFGIFLLYAGGVLLFSRGKGDSGGKNQENFPPKKP